LRYASNMTKRTVTVLVDTYNHERFIEEAIVSVLEQDFSPAEMEVIVVDDGSTDRTPEIVRKFAPRVRLLQKSNGGQASAFNAGIPEAQGEVVAFLDGDDWWAREKLSRVMEAIAADNALGIVGHGIVMIHLDGRHESEILREDFRFQASTPEGARLFRLRRSFLGTSRMTIRTDILRRIGPVPESLVVEADEYLFTLAAALAGGQILPDALTYYRFHEANGFQLSRFDPARVRRKQEALRSLARNLSDQLAYLAIDSEASRTITEIVQAEADQLRLMLDGGAPLETVHAEWMIYDVHSPQAAPIRRLFKRLSLLPALLLPPQTYYRLRDRLVKSRLYASVRANILPNPPRHHVTNAWRSEPEVLPPNSTRSS
jgi:GT2 family glycosyltransferase